MSLKRTNKFYTTIKMLTLRDLETYLMVKDYMEEDNINIEGLLKSMNCKNFPITIKATFHLTISMRGQRATGKI